MFVPCLAIAFAGNVGKSLVARPQTPAYTQLASGVDQVRSVQNRPFWFTLGGGDDNPTLKTTLERRPIADRGLPSCGVAEWGYSFFHLKNGQEDGAGYKHYGGYPTPPKTRQEAMQVVHNYYLRLCADARTKATPEQLKNFFSISGHYCFQHYACEWGCNIVGSEVGENINSIQAHIAFTRGAARQYAKPWLIDFSSWYGPSIYDEDPKRAWGEYSGPTHGHSLSLHLRTYYAAYMAGANILFAEGGSQNFFRSQTPDADGTLPLSALGREGTAFYRFTRRHPDRGIPYVPVALLLDFYHGIYPGFGDKKTWDAFPYTPGDQSVLDALNVFFPGSLGDPAQREQVGNMGGDPVKNETGYMQSEAGRLVASPYGDIADVLLTNAPADVLANYPVLIWLGEQTPDPSLAPRLRDYVSHGGTLLVREADAKSLPFLRTLVPPIHPLPPAGFTRYRQGKGAVLVFGPRQEGQATAEQPLAKILRQIRPELIPIDVGGKLQTLYNRTADGWVVTLINNEGVTKTFREAARIDPNKAQTVPISYHGPGRVASATLWGVDADQALTADRIQVTVPPGEVRIVKICTADTAQNGRAANRGRANEVRAVETAPAQAPTPDPSPKNRGGENPVPAGSLPLRRGGLGRGVFRPAGRLAAGPLDGSFIDPAHIGPARCREIRTASRLGIANGRMSLLFDRQTGALTSLHNDACKDEYLKRPALEGNPFRLYVDTTQLPPPATDPGWWGGKIEGDLGGKLVDAAGCRLTTDSFRRDGAAGVLTLSLRHEAPALTCTLQIRLADGDNAADCTLTIRNDGSESHTVLPAFPHLTGLQLGPHSETNLGLLLHSYGTPGVPAWKDAGGFYGRETAMQWQAVYDPADDGFGFIVMDPELRPKLLRRFAPSGMSALYLPAFPLAPGASLRLPAARLVVHRGNWRVVARRYGDWFRQHFKPRPSPRWLRDVDLFVGPWIPDAKTVAEAKKRPETGGFTSFRQMPQLYLNDQYDLKEWAQYNEGVLTNPATYGAYMADGTYYLRSDLGGAKAMREGVERLHKLGRRVMFYVAGNSVLRDSAVLKGTRPEDWMLMDKPGHMLDIGYPNGLSVCPGYGPWQDHLAQVCKRLLKETGADGIRLDELANFTPCFNPAHHHANPFDSNRWLHELCRKVRAAMDEVNPDAILNTEGPLDHLHEYCNGALQMFPPGRDIDAMRVALPGYIGFAYHPGAVESARNGWVGGKTTARRVEWPWTDYRGMSGRPSYYRQGPGPETRWHELRESFPEAVIDGNVTVEDPATPDAPHWVGRLWRGRHYWLMVGGNEDGSPLSGKARVRLPELPPQVKVAYEFDAETLAMRDAHLRREGGVPWITVTSGFSAVLLPLPDCPPLLRMPEARITLKRGEAKEIALTAFSPWRTESSAITANVSAPGLEASPARLTLSGSLRLKAPSDAELGWYFLRLSGGCLPLKRWIHIQP